MGLGLGARPRPLDAPVMTTTRRAPTLTPPATLGDSRPVYSLPSGLNAPVIALAAGPPSLVPVFSLVPKSTLSSTTARGAARRGAARSAVRRTATPPAAG